MIHKEGKKVKGGANTDYGVGAVAACFPLLQFIDRGKVSDLEHLERLLKAMVEGARV